MVWFPSKAKSSYAADRLKMLTQAAIEGLAYSGLYSMLGLGYYLTYGVLRRVDLAYGTVAMTAVYLAAMSANSYGLAWYAVPLVSIAFGLLLANGVSFVAFDLVRSDLRYSMAATLGIWMAIEELLIQSPARGRAQPLDNPWQGQIWDFGGLQVRVDHIVVIVLAGLAMVCIGTFLQRTRQGLAIRVATFDSETAILLGMSPSRLRLLATAIAAGAGCLAAWTFSVAQSGIDIHFGMWVTIKGLVILALAGTERLSLVAAAALLLGIGERVATELVGAGLRDLLSYSLILALLAAEAFHPPSTGGTRRLA
ncbi:branched-chain amino acid ABC transporter permease [Bradyrhizobium sp. CIR3A]|uniref:branched-chain amino acid ABC transporter permease n=1 Tax=Bradyrhizobium sp. CIR3A TaxID=2663838 RepID=UPI0016059F20|nr:branched-chain amino acid ABC transporter permease [Bradyrhizobium sp. CIR3A]MBB4261357.1 branched-chain amino acid transport system permease protein [Bradyrhizobium sp. CIR3A]